MREERGGGVAEKEKEVHIGEGGEGSRVVLFSGG